MGIASVALLDLGFFDMLGILGWAWKFLLVLVIWGFVQNSLGFSPTVALIVAVILVYILVVQHPFITSVGYILYFILGAGLLFVVPMLLPMHQPSQKEIYARVHAKMMRGHQ